MPRPVSHPGQADDSVDSAVVGGAHRDIAVIGDATVANTARVMSASTSPVATDTALNVTISPNSAAHAVTSTPAVATQSLTSSAATTNATSVKASAGNLYAVVASNVGAAAAFLKLYNKASAPTVGTDVPILTIPIAASGVVNLLFGVQGARLGTGIAFAITNLVADSDTTAVAAAQVKVIISYI